MKKVIALLQARTDSSRLPGKVLKNILDKPMIVHQLQRTSKSKYINELILVTSSESSDDQLASVVNEYGFKFFRGDKNNVLKRFFDAVQTLDLTEEDVIVRLTGDCPLHDANIIDETIASFLNRKCDYLANCIKPVYPDGLDVEVFTYKALKIACLNATKLSDLEHVTPYIRNNGTLSVKDLDKVSIHADWRLTVDEEKDFDLIVKIFEHFNSTYFSFEDIVKFLNKNKSLLNMNKSIIRNEGYIKSLSEEI